MANRRATILRGHAKLLEDVRRSIMLGWDDAAIQVLDGVIANLRADADREEQASQDWLREREQELKKLGIPNGGHTFGGPKEVLTPEQLDRVMREGGEYWTWKVIQEEGK